VEYGCEKGIKKPALISISVETPFGARH